MRANVSLIEFVERRQQFAAPAVAPAALTARILLREFGLE